MDAKQGFAHFRKKVSQAVVSFSILFKQTAPVVQSLAAFNIS